MTSLLDIGYEGGKQSLVLPIKDSLQSLYEHPACPPLLYKTLGQVTTWQERVETTLGIAIRWSPDFGAIMQVMGARIIKKGNSANYDDPQALSEFLKQRGTIASLSEIHLPLDVPQRLFGHAHVSRTPADMPIVAVYAAVDLNQKKIGSARVALTGVWRENVQLAESVSLLQGQHLDKDSIQTVSEAISKETNPKGNYSGSAEYRRAMAEVLTRRALTMCMEAIQ